MPSITWVSHVKIKDLVWQQTAKAPGVCIKCQLNTEGFQAVRSCVISLNDTNFMWCKRRKCHRLTGMLLSSTNIHRYIHICNYACMHACIQYIRQQQVWFLQMCHEESICMSTRISLLCRSILGTSEALICNSVLIWNWSFDSIRNKDRLIHKFLLCPYLLQEY